MSRFILLVFAAAVAGACGDDPINPGATIAPNWSFGEPLPIPLAAGGAAVYRGEIYVAGGYRDQHPTAAAFRFSPATNQWTPLADLPTVRVSTQLLVVGDTLYAVGGNDAGQAPIMFQDQGMWAFDVAADAWVERPQLPDRRDSPAVAATHDRILVLGGHLGSIDHGGLTPGDTAAWYEVASGRWQYGARMHFPRTHPDAVVLGGVAYVLGGATPSLGNRVDEIESYDPATDTWSVVGVGYVDQTVSSGAPTVVAFADRIHLLGGWFGPGGVGVADHLAYDPGADAWERLPPLPTARAAALTVVLDGALYVMGGQIRHRNQPDPITDVVEIFTFDPVP